MPGTEWIAPTIAGVIAVLTAGIAGIISIRNTRAGAVENRAPTANQAWNETDRARERMHAFEDLFYAARAALKHLMRSVKEAHPDHEFTPDVVAASKLEAPDDDDKK